VRASSINKIIDFLGVLPFFELMNQGDIVKFAGKSLLRKYASSTVVIKQNDEPTNIFVVKGGRIKVIRNIKFRVSAASPGEIVSDLDGPTPAELELQQFKLMPLEIDEVGPGESFCDFEILTKSYMHTSYVTAIPCEVLAISQYDYLNLVPKTIMNAIKQRTKSYPSDYELRAIYFQSNRWNAFKSRILNNTLAEIKMKRM
jgi:CRP-like cAMP-binding protein